MSKNLCQWLGVILALLALTLWASAGVAFAAEIEIGDAQIHHGMKIGAVYIQPVTMEPMKGLAGMGLPRNKADIHLEADIEAVKDNSWGFAAGSWVPHLTVMYRWTKVDTGESGWGLFGSMVANDGPHYGANVKLAGVGRYRLTYQVEPPSLARHTDKETGVPAWFEPFDISWEFTFLGVGKKGGY